MNSIDLIDKVLSEHNISQNELAKILDVEPGTLSRWKNGVHATPISALCLISYYFDIPLATAVDFDAHIAPHKNLHASISSKIIKYKDINDKSLAKTALAVAEDLKAGPVSYTQLLQDARYEHHKLNGNFTSEPFQNGDILFYRLENINEDAYVLFQREKQVPEVYYLQHSNRNIYLKSLTLKGESIHYNKEGRKEAFT